MRFSWLCVAILAPLTSASPLLGPSVGGVTRPNLPPSSGTSTGSTSDFGGGGDGSTLMQMGDLETTEMPTVFTYTESVVTLTSQPTPEATHITPVARITSILPYPPHENDDWQEPPGNPYLAGDYKAEMTEIAQILLKTEEGMRLEGHEFTMFVLRRACNFSNRFSHVCPNICLYHEFC